MNTIAGKKCEKNNITRIFIINELIYPDMDNYD